MLSIAYDIVLVEIEFLCYTDEIPTRGKSRRWNSCSMTFNLTPAFYWTKSKPTRIYLTPYQLIVNTPGGISNYFSHIPQ